MLYITGTGAHHALHHWDRCPSCSTSLGQVPIMLYITGTGAHHALHHWDRCPSCSTSLGQVPIMLYITGTGAHHALHHWDRCPSCSTSLGQVPIMLYIANLLATPSTHLLHKPLFPLPAPGIICSVYLVAADITHMWLTHLRLSDLT